MSQINLPNDLVVDLRMPVAGDSFSWAGTEPAAAKKSLVFHHSASDAPAEDGFSIAEYHVNHNGWGGVGYHFVITRQDYPGRAGQTSPGAQIQYVGDLASYRAHVANQNPGRVGICFVGMTPDPEQLKLGRKLADFLMAPNNILPSINYFSQVTVHRLVPDQSTACPGDDFQDWLPYLQGGAEPASFHPAPAPEPTPQPEPAPVEIPVEVVESPEWEQTWLEDHTISPKVVAVPSADVFDPVSNSVLKKLPGGEPVAQIAGYYKFNGNTYYRTQWAFEHGKWNGILQNDVKDLEIPVPQPPINPGAPVDSIQPPASSPLDGPAFPEEDEPHEEAPQNDRELFKSLWQMLLGLLLSPLRLIGFINTVLRRG